MCECYQIGGRFIAEDPNCPIHGWEAQHEERRRSTELDALEKEIRQAGSIEELRELMLQMLDVIRGS